MKKISLGLIFALSSSAMWAGTMGPAREGNNWSGFYIGGNLGGIWSNFKGLDTTAAFTAPASPFVVAPLINYAASPQPYNANTGSVIGGIQFGHNWQMNNFMLGTEISIDGMGLNKTQVLTASDIYNQDMFAAGDSFSSHINWQAEWVGRLGLIQDNWLVYALGGFAATQAKVGADIIAGIYGGAFYPATGQSSKNILIGGAVGGGVEYALTQHLHLGVEYRYSDYGSYDYYTGVNAVVQLGGGYIYAPMIANMNLSTNQVLAKLNYQF